MKVVLSHAIPFSLAHGGTQTVIEALYRHLPAQGCTVEHERWWDASQTSDLVHYFGRPSDLVSELALKKGRRIVITEFLDRTSARPKWLLAGQAALIRMVRRGLPGFVNRMGWVSLKAAHALVYAVKSEVATAQLLFGVDPRRCHVVPHGLDRAALEALGAEAPSGGYLISVGTIDPRKNSLVLARAAKLAGVPVVFVGAPYADDAYHRAFVAEVDNRLVVYKGRVTESEKTALMRQANGFVLLSEYESGCIAVHEAAAARLPMLLARRPWAISDYAALSGVAVTEPTLQAAAEGLRGFQAKAVRLERMTFPVHSWEEVAGMYRQVYEGAGEGT
jgi:glycosyltransferase involved in cell wall biosynthesis